MRGRLHKMCPPSEEIPPERRFMHASLLGFLSEVSISIIGLPGYEA